MKRDELMVGRQKFLFVERKSCTTQDPNRIIGVSDTNTLSYLFTTL